MTTTSAEIANIETLANFPSNLHWCVLGVLTCDMNNSGSEKIKLWDRIRAMSEKECAVLLKPAKQTWVVVDEKGALLHFVVAPRARDALAMFRRWAAPREARKGHSIQVGAVMNLARWSRRTGLTKATCGYGHLVIK